MWAAKSQDRPGFWVLPATGSSERQSHFVFQAFIPAVQSQLAKTQPLQTSSCLIQMTLPPIKTTSLLKDSLI